MKNLKTLTAAVAIFAVVGGALAFNSVKTSGKLYKCNTTSNKCVLQPTDYTYGIGDPIPQSTTLDAAKDQPCSSSCPNSFVATPQS